MLKTWLTSGIDTIGGNQYTRDLRSGNESFVARPVPSSSRLAVVDARFASCQLMHASRLRTNSLSGSLKLLTDAPAMLTFSFSHRHGNTTDEFLLACGGLAKPPPDLSTDARPSESHRPSNLPKKAGSRRVSPQQPRYLILSEAHINATVRDQSFFLYGTQRRRRCGSL